MRRSLSGVLVGTIVAVALLAGGPHAWALTKPEGYPSRNIEIVNPFPAGGSTDLYVRTLAVPLERILGRKVIIINEPGGEGVRAFKEVQGRQADGYTLFAVGPEEIINSVYGRIDYKEFAPIARVQMDQSVYWVKADSRFKTFQDAVAYAKANPHKAVWGGSYGIDQVVTSLLFKAAGVSVRYVPFGVGKEATVALLGGHVEVLHEEPGGIVAQIEGKMVRPLIVLSEERLPMFPDVPTARELGYDLTIGRWRGIAARKGTQPEIAQYLAAAIQEAMRSPEYQALATKTIMNLRPGYLGPAEFGRFLQTEFETYSRGMRSVGLVQ